ncbi:MAG: FAD-dependent monooxygenase [Rhodospirillaceae bacterium]|jgi:3-(3-hydroxy-phenyl)propionate hydroxylase|nr:FAD-dependent monooxygenase [Rhodospirillaceae bacterium]
MPTLNQKNDCIIIVGGGPVGMITALRLAQLDIPVVVLDALAETPTAHRAATTHSSTLDLLDSVGLTDAIIEHGLTARYFQYRYRTTNEVFAEFDFGRLADESNHPYAVQLEQHKTVAIALAAAEKFPHFEFHREHTVMEVVNEADHAGVVTKAPDGEKKTWRGRYVIGCDGGRSTVRKSQGISFPGFTWEERFIIVASYFDYEAADDYRYRNYLADPGQWCSVFKIPGPEGPDNKNGMWRNLFPIITDDPDDVVTSEPYIRNMINTCFPYAKDLEIVHSNLYSVHQRVAESFHKNRIMLAGDAGHINNPLGGMGMNSGIADGLNLAEKMGQIWRDEITDDQTLFAKYDRQRRPLAQKYVQTQSIQNKETLQAKDPEKAAARFEEMRKTAEDPKRHKAFLMNASLINMVREAGAIE